MPGFRSLELHRGIETPSRYLLLVTSARLVRAAVTTDTTAQASSRRGGSPRPRSHSAGLRAHVAESAAAGAAEYRVRLDHADSLTPFVA